MAKVLSSIVCNWNSRGEITHSISSGYSSTRQNIELILAPSLPMLISHQLGAFRPSHGLILCGQVIDLYKNNKHILFPINSVLKSVRMNFHKLQNGVTITFHPKGGLFANNDSLEEGTRQFINNYLFYVSNLIKGETFLICRALVSATLLHYFEFLNLSIENGMMGLKKDNWSISFTQNMAIMTQAIAENYAPEYEAGTDLDKVREVFNEKIIEAQNIHNDLCQIMGLSRRI